MFVLKYLFSKKNHHYFSLFYQEHQAYKTKLFQVETSIFNYQINTTKDINQLKLIT